MRWNAYGDMIYSITNNEPAFNHLFGQGYFDFISHHPEIAAEFDEGMKNISLEEDAYLATAYPFGSYEIIADIGGGKGNFLVQVLQHTIHTQGILYDLEHTIDAAQIALASTSCHDRIACKVGNFFESVPSGADVYILKRILHDWNDVQCITILQNCKKAMKPEARLLIIETIVQNTNERDFAKDIDMAMLVLFGGKERTHAEWESLVTQAGLRIASIYKTESLVQIIEVTA